MSLKNNAPGCPCCPGDVTPPGDCFTCLPIAPPGLPWVERNYNITINCTFEVKPGNQQCTGGVQDRCWEPPLSQSVNQTFSAPFRYDPGLEGWIGDLDWPPNPWTGPAKPTNIAIELYDETRFKWLDTVAPGQVPFIPHYDYFALHVPRIKCLNANRVTIELLWYEWGIGNDVNLPDPPPPNYDDGPTWGWFLWGVQVFDAGLPASSTTDYVGCQEYTLPFPIEDTLANSAYNITGTVTVDIS